MGFYGGVNYGFGYGGVGFAGGVWAGNVFRYNTAVVNVNTSVVHDTFVDRTVVHEGNGNHASFNGPGGVEARPTEQERLAMNEHHEHATAAQRSHEHSAAADRSQWASTNGGHPSAAAMSRVSAARARGTPVGGHAGTAAGEHAGNQPHHDNATHVPSRAHPHPNAAAQRPGGGHAPDHEARGAGHGEGHH